MTSAANTLRVIEILNPLSLDKRVESHQEWTPSKPLIDYVPDDGNEWIVSVSGGIVAADQWESLVPAPDDEIVMVPVLGGGGGGVKNILRIVAFIALAYFTAGLANGFVMGGVAVTGATAAAVAAGVTIAGTMLINAVLPVPAASMGGSQNDLSESPSYGINGPRNTALEGIPVPVVYGKHRMSGNILNLYTVNIEKTQILYMLMNAGEGPIQGLTDIRINDQPLDYFKDVETVIRTGEPEQDPIAWFDDSLTSIDVGNPEVPFGANPVTHGIIRQTQMPVDKLRIDLLAPMGMSMTDNKGNVKPTSVPLAIQYKRVTTAGEDIPGEGWQSNVAAVMVSDYSTVYEYPPVGEYGDNGEFIGHLLPKASLPEPRPGDVVNGSQILDAGGKTVGYVHSAANLTNIGDVVNGSASATFSGKSRYPIRISFQTPELEQGYYVVAISRLNVKSEEPELINQVNWEALVQIITDDVSYTNTALLGLKIRLSDQINGVPNVSYVNHGLRVRQLDPETNTWVEGESHNPAWAALDMLTNERYGGAIPLRMIDIEAFKRWAQFCNVQSPPLRFDAVIDQTMSIWDVMKYVCRAGHAQIIRSGTKFSVVIEGPEEPMMLFSEANIVKGTFNVSWLPMAERANAIEVTFWDQEDFYKQKTIKVIDPSLENLADERVAQLQLVGITNRERAIREAHLQLNMNNWLTRTVTFEAGLDALACTLGSVVQVKHIATQNQAAGRLVGYDEATETWTLDQNVEIGAEYQQLTIYKPVDRCATEYEVESVSGWASNSRTATLLLSGVSVGSTLGSSSMADANLIRVPLVSGNVVTLPILAVEAVGIDSCRVEVELDGHTIGSMPETGTANPESNAYRCDRLVQFYVNAGTEPNQAVNALSASPAALPDLSTPEDVHWILSTTSSTRRLYRVVGIEGGADDTTRRVTAIEYDDRIYETDGVLPPPVIGAPPPPERIGHVEMLDGTERLVAKNFEGEYTLDMKWEVPLLGYYEGATIFAGAEGSDEWETLGTVEGGQLTFSAFSNEPGDVIYLRVQAFDKNGDSASFSGAPTLTWTVGQGVTIGEVEIEDFVVTPGARSNHARWTAAEPFRVSSYQIKYVTAADEETLPAVHTAATMLATLPAMVTSFDHLNINVGAYRYWVRGIPVGASVEDYDANEGWTVSGVVRPLNSMTDLLDFLDDQISSTHLDELLRSRIDLLEDVEERIAAIDIILERLALIDQIPNVFERLEGLVDYETFIRVTSHLTRIGQLLQTDSVRILETQQQIQTASESAAATTTILAARMDNAEAGIIEERQVRASEDLAEAAARLVLAAQVDNYVAVLEDDISAVATDVSAEVTARRQLAAFLVGDEDGEVVSGGVILTEQNVRATADTALATEITRVEARLDTGGDVHAQIVDLATTRATIDYVNDEVSAEAERIDAIRAVIGTEGGVLGSRIQEIESTRATIEYVDGQILEVEAAISTEASRISEIESEITNPGGELGSRITTIEATRATIDYVDDEIETQADRIDNIESVINNPGGILGSRITTIEQTQATNHSSQATRLDNIESLSISPSSPLRSRISTLEQTAIDLADGGTVTAARVDNIEASIGDDTTPGSILGRITETEDVVLTPTTGLVSQITTLNLQMAGTNGSGLNTAIQERLTIDQYEASYSVRIDSNGYVSGFGLANSIDPNGAPTSNFIIHADNFAVAAPGSTDFALIVSGGRVYMDGASIGDLTVGSGQIADGAISALHIGSTSVSFTLTSTTRIIVFYRAFTIAGVDSTPGVCEGNVEILATVSGAVTGEASGSRYFFLDNENAIGPVRTTGVVMDALPAGSHTINLGMSLSWSGFGTPTVTPGGSVFLDLVVMEIKK